MDQLKKNAFWVAMGAVGLAILAFFWIAVFPKWGEKATLRKKLAAAVGGPNGIKTVHMPGDPDIERFMKFRDEALKNYTDITSFYTESSKFLGRWFPGIGEDPPRDGFMSKYRGEVTKLEEDLKKKGVKIGISSPDDEDKDKKPKFGFNWEDNFQFDQAGGPEEQRRVLKELQKRFWARQRVANAILSGGVNVSRIVDFRFFRRLHDKLTGAWEQAPSGADAVHYLGLGTRSDSGVVSNYTEYDLPDDLGKTLTFGFAVELPYSEVPKLLKEILNPTPGENASQRLLVSIVGAEVTIREQNPPEREYTYTKGNKEEEIAAIAKAKEDIKPLNMLLTVTCQIIDFDPTKVKPFGAKEPEAK
jgi:hypothetical protein